MKKYILITVFITLSLSQSYGQLIDVLQAHAGLAFFPTDLKRNAITNFSEDLYAGFDAGKSIGVGASKFLTDKFQLGVDVEYMGTAKKFYTMNNFRTAVFLKFNLIPPDIYKVSPYLIVSGSSSFITLNQAAHPDRAPVQDGYNTAGSIQINTITNRDEEYAYKALVWGGAAGAGLDYNFYSSYSLFGEITYSYNFAKSSSLQDSENQFTASNKSQLTYVNLIFGIRIYMY